MDFKDFYKTPWVSKGLCDQFWNRYINIRFSFGMRRHYNSSELKLISEQRLKLRGTDENPFFEIHSVGHRKDPTSLTYFIEQGAIEFIPEVSEIFDLDRTDTIIIDLDPKNPEFDFDALRYASYDVLTCLLGTNCAEGPNLSEDVVIKRYKLRFSGNRSFHLYLKLNGLHTFPVIRELVKTRLDTLTGSRTDLSYKNVRDRKDYILVDIGAIARHRCVRSLWSVHAKTGMVCVPVSDLFSFDRESATIDNVLSGGYVEELF